MIHQAAKIKDVQAKDNFLNWLWDFEFKKFNLPVPDCVIFWICLLNSVKFL